MRTTSPRVRDEQDARIDAALADSFPASDPPPWTLRGPSWSEGDERE